MVIQILLCLYFMQILFAVEIEAKLEMEIQFVKNGPYST